MFGRKKLLERIEALEAKVRRLENMHATILPKDSWEMPGFIRFGAMWENGKQVGYYNGRQLNSAEVELQPYHPQPKQVDYKRITNVPAIAANTEKLKGVTMEELARYVLDGTPITRKVKEPVTYITEHGPESITSKVCTRLGDITMIEKE